MAIIFPNTIAQFVTHFFRPYRVFFITMLLINMFVAVYVTIQPYVIKKLIDAATPLLGQEALIRATLIPASILILLTILNNLAWRLNNYVHLKSLPNLKADIVDAASDYMRGHSYKFFQDNLSGAITNRIGDLANNTDSLIFNCRMLFQNFLMIINAIVIFAVVNPFFSIIFIVWTLFFVRFSFYCSRNIEPFSQIFAESRSNVIGNVADSFANSINVISFAREQYEKKFLGKSLDIMVVKDQALQTKLMGYAFIMSGLTISVQIITVIMLIYLGAKGILTVGDFALVFMLTIGFLEHVWNFTETWFRVAEQIGIFKQALGFISVPHTIIDADDASQLKVTTGTIVFSRVHFFYNENQSLFEDKTFVINGREKVGLVGYSGSGKSTLVNLITRTFDIQSGEILLDNQPIRSVTLQSLREQIAFIPQDPTLFHRTLMDNIRYGKLEATDEEVIEAAKKAYVHEFVQEMPDGYNTLVGERGVKLSGGQRQRIAIARAILKDAPILILDEATSALDSHTEALIQESLRYAMQNKTVIVIAHRLSTIKSMHRILVFEQGRIVEEGTHEYLLEKGQIYKSLWQAQQGFLSG